MRHLIAPAACALLVVLAFSSGNGAAGEGKDLSRQLGFMSRDIRNLQDENTELKAEIEFIKKLPTVAREYKAAKKREREAEAERDNK